MADQLESTGSKSDEFVALSFSMKQLDLIFNNEELSDVTLMSDDNQLYHVRWTVLQLRWMWFGGLKNAEQARNVHEGDKRRIKINICGKMLHAILKWAYYDTVDLTGWTFDELSVFIEKCGEYSLRELEEAANDQLKRMAMEGNVEPAEIGQISEYATKAGDQELIDRVVRIAIDRMEAVTKTQEFSSFSPELVAKMADGLAKEKYPMFMKSIPKWSRGRSSKELDVVMKYVDWSVVPDELMRKLASHYAWNSKEVREELEKWTICEKNECPVAKELILTVDHVSYFEGYGSRSSSADLFSFDRFFESTRRFYFYFKNKVNCEKVSWNCKSGRVTSVVMLSDDQWLEVDVCGESAFFPPENISRIDFLTTWGSLINNIRLSLT